MDYFIMQHFLLALIIYQCHIVQTVFIRIQGCVQGCKLSQIIHAVLVI